MRPLRDEMWAAVLRAPGRTNRRRNRDPQAAPERPASLEHEGGALVVAHLPFGEQHDAGATMIIAGSVQLGIQALFGTPNTSGKSPF